MDFEFNFEPFPKKPLNNPEFWKKIWDKLDKSWNETNKLLNDIQKDLMNLDKAYLIEGIVINFTGYGGNND